MLTMYLALGLLGVAIPAGQSGSQSGTTSALVTPADRVIKLTRSVTPVAAQQSMRHADRSDYVVDITGELADGESAVVVSFAVPDNMTLLGFMIDTLPPYAPVHLDAGRLLVWPKVDPAARSDPAWAQPQACTVEIDVDTNSNPSRHFKRTALIMVQR